MRTAFEAATARSCNSQLKGQGVFGKNLPGNGMLLHIFDQLSAAQNTTWSLNSLSSEELTFDIEVVHKKIIDKLGVRKNANRVFRRALYDGQIVCATRILAELTSNRATAGNSE